MEKAFRIAKKVDKICRNCDVFDSDPETGGMYGICEYQFRMYPNVPPEDTVKEANQYCDVEEV